MTLAMSEAYQHVSGASQPQPKEAGKNYEDLTPDMMEKARACKTPAELVALAQEEGIELTEEQLQAVTGGWGHTEYADYCEVRGCSSNECNKLYGCEEYTCYGVSCGSLSCISYMEHNSI